MIPHNTHDTHDTYEELMSLKLDGGLGTSEERHLSEHLENCAGCAQLWSFYQKADSMLRTSAQAPVPVPATFQAKVMAQIAIVVPGAQGERAVTIENPPFFVPHAATGRLTDTPSLQNIGLGMGVPSAPLVYASTGAAATSRLSVSPTIGLPDFALGWQKSTITYLRNTAAVLLSVTGVLALLLALVLSGVIKVGGAVGDGISTLRTFFEAVGAWAGAFFATSGAAIVTGGTLLAAILVLVGWQVVTGYQRSALENRGQTGALTGPLEIAM
ncbi:MAG TPA: anti-sigma factor [Chloroflexia bacterium]|nr:anti-sigma factor [Chloroflexia bacterium]